jgi:ubiquinone/menaquinone biosynthesis C-methylase UbiE
VSSLALMRWLESAPERYDAGMRIVTLGRVGGVHDAVAALAAPAPGARVLEIGCGTGAVTERLASRGASVTALDQNPEMMEGARARLARDAGVAARVEWYERTAAEIDTLPEAGFDAVVLCLVLSEMSAPERRFVLVEARRRLAPGGRLVAADEVQPARRAARAAFRALRAPQALLGWLLAGSVSHPLADLRGELEAAGFDVRSEQRWLLGSLAVYEAVPGA